MAEKMSTALCNKLLDTNCLKTIFNAAEIRIYSGSVPATADAAITGSLIATVKQAAGSLGWGASAVAGVLAKSGTAWTDPSATGGVATHYRLVQSADDDSADSGFIHPRVQGTVGTGGADMNVGNTTITASSTFEVNYFTQAFIPS
jgi:hypothetical protein